MKDTEVAIRYARALFGASGRNVSAARSALGKFVEVFKSQPGFVRFLSSPRVPTGEKEKAFRSALPAKSPAVLESFLKLVLRNKRLDLVPLIGERFGTLADEAEGVTRATVHSSLPLSEEQKKAVTGALGRVFGKTVEGEFREDDRLIGGLVARVGDKVIDLSVAGQLSRWKKDLVRAS